jgi:hypothetical protein
LTLLCHANHEARSQALWRLTLDDHLRAGCYRNPTCPDAHQRDPDRRPHSFIDEASAAFERYAAARSIAAFERYAAGSTPSAGTLSTLARQGAPRLGSTRAQSLTESPGGTPGLGRYFTSSAPSGKGANRRR